MISVVIPLYNKELAVRSTLESVLAQTFLDFEVVVVNDGSTDNSAAVVRGFIQKDNRIRLIDKENGGVCSARNQGIKESHGEYIALLDADDIWDKDYLGEQIRMINDFPEAAMWGINYVETNNGQLVRKLETNLPDGYRGYVDNYFEMSGRVSDLFCSSSVVIRKSVFDKVGLFDERIKYAEDNDMWFRIIATNRVAFFDCYMVFYRLEAENRALKRERKLTQFLPYYVDKYNIPLYKQNVVFYRWINRWAAQQLRRYYFSLNKEEQHEAAIAVRKLDYSVIPIKYQALYRAPLVLSKLFHVIDQWKTRIRQRIR